MRLLASRSALAFAVLAISLALATSAAAQSVRTERVQFRRGATSATVNGSAVRGERVRYVLGASAGQRMGVTIRSNENNAVFAVGSDEGIEEWPATFTEFTGRLAESGDYAVEVWGTRGNATYTVTFTIR